MSAHQITELKPYAPNLLVNNLIMSAQNAGAGPNNNLHVMNQTVMSFTLDLGSQELINSATGSWSNVYPLFQMIPA